MKSRDGRKQMKSSTVTLGDPGSVWIDQKAKTLAYFCISNPVRVDEEILAELKEISAKNGDTNVRLCLHEGPDAEFHEMVILERRSNYYRPHKHLAKGESYHIIEGTQGVVIFDQDGTVIDRCILEPRGDTIYRVGANMFHAVMPLSDLIIYHEAKPGPFIPEKDSVFPKWAPDGSNPGEVAAFVAKLIQGFNTP